jgi:hypothetical protein
MTETPLGWESLEVMRCRIDVADMSLGSAMAGAAIAAVWHAKDSTGIIKLREKMDRFVTLSGEANSRFVEALSRHKPNFDVGQLNAFASAHPKFLSDKHSVERLLLNAHQAHEAFLRVLYLECDPNAVAIRDAEQAFKRSHCEAKEGLDRFANAYFPAADSTETGT